MVILGDDAFQTLRCCDVEGWIHHLTCKLYIRARSEGEGAQGDNGQLIVHLAFIERETTSESHLSFWRHAQF